MIVKDLVPVHNRWGKGKEESDTRVIRTFIPHIYSIVNPEAPGLPPPLHGLLVPAIVRRRVRWVFSRFMIGTAGLDRRGGSGYLLSYRRYPRSF
jgi:hypothetical protein